MTLKIINKVDNSNNDSFGSNDDNDVKDYGNNDSDDNYSNFNEIYL